MKPLYKNDNIKFDFNFEIYTVKHIEMFTTNILLNLLFEHDENGDEIRFTLDDIKKMITEKGVDNITSECNIFGDFMLMKHGLIDKEVFFKKIKAKYVPEEDAVHIITDDITDVIKTDYEFVFKGEYNDIYFDVDVSTRDFDYYYPFKNDVMMLIHKYLIDNNIEIEDDNGDEVQITSENSTINSKNDIEVETEDGTYIVTIEDIDRHASDLFTEIANAYRSAYESEYNTNIEKAVDQNFNKTIGTYTRTEETRKVYQTDKATGKYVPVDKQFDVIDIKLKFSMKEIMDTLQDSWKYDTERNKLHDFTTEYSSIRNEDLVDVCKEQDLFDYDDPDSRTFDGYFSKDNKYFNDMLIENISNLL